MVEPGRVIEEAAIREPESELEHRMARPLSPPTLNPRKPYAVVGWIMQKQREIHGWDGKDVATKFGVSASHISRVENGRTMPSRSLVNFYEEHFEAEGILHSLYEAAIEADEQARRRFGGARPKLYNALPGDASEFIADTIPHGTLMKPGEIFVKAWTIRNAGTVPWHGRQLERQGPITGPGLISSARHVPIPDAEPGETIEIRTGLKAPTYDCSSIAYFKMAFDDGRLCFPGNYQLGLDVLVMVRGQMPDRE